MRFFRDLGHVTALMSERPDGPMGRSTNDGVGGEYAANRLRFLERHGIDPRQVVMAGLVHGLSVRVLSSVPRGRRVESTDGLVSLGPALAIATQDCFPLFFAPLDPSDSHAVAGIAHAGWPGVVNGIAGKVVTELELHGLDRRRNLAVAIGAGIRSCCFIIRDDARGLSQYLDRGYGAFVEEAGVSRDGEKQWRVDLVGILLYQLQDQLSIPAEHIEVAAPCTCCAVDAAGGHSFFSWRRGGLKGTNMLSVIRLNTGRGVEVLSL